MPISNPNQLVEEFKKSGEFDRLRRELLAEFQKGEGLPGFKRKLEDIGRETIRTKRAAEIDALYLEKDKKLKLRDDLVQDIKRFPVVERAVADMQMFSDSVFLDGIRSSAFKILRKDRGEIVESAQDSGFKLSVSQNKQEVDESVTSNVKHDVEGEKHSNTSEMKMETSSTSTPILAVTNLSSSSSTHSGSNSTAIGPTNPTASSASVNDTASRQNIYTAETITIKPEITQPFNSMLTTPSPVLPGPDVKPSHLAVATAPSHLHAPNVSNSGLSEISPASSSSQSAKEVEEEKEKTGTITTPDSTNSLPSVPVKAESDSSMHVTKE